MHLISHAMLPLWISILLGLSAVLIVTGIVAGAITESSRHAWLVTVASICFGGGIALLAVLGFITAAVSAQQDSAARANLISQGRQVYDLHLTTDQAQKLLQHKVVTLNDGTRILLHHLHGRLYGFDQEGKDTPLLPTSGMPLALL